MTTLHKNVTTIRISTETKNRLEKLKIHPREPFENALKRLITNYYDASPLSKEAIKGIENALQNIKEGKVYNTKEIRRRLKL